MITNKDKIKTTPQKSYRTIKTDPFRSVKISGENRFFYISLSNNFIRDIIIDTLIDVLILTNSQS